MDRKQSRRIMGLLCVVYGLLVGVLGATHSEAVGKVAMIGALVLAVGWMSIGVVGKKEIDRD